MPIYSPRYVHLTNYSVNKNSGDFVSNESADSCEGHKWSLRALFRYWEEEGRVDPSAVWNSIVDVVSKTLVAADGPINTHSKVFLPQRSNG